jgi:hypothetical protein
MLIDWKCIRASILLTEREEGSQKGRVPGQPICFCFYTYGIPFVHVCNITGARLKGHRVLVSNCASAVVRSNNDSSYYLCHLFCFS